MRYTAESIQAAVEQDRVQLFAEYSHGRAPNWSCDQATRDLVCTAKYLSLELSRLGASDDHRRALGHLYNRWTRGDGDYFSVAAQALNIFLDGRTDEFRRTDGSREHRGW